MLVLLTDMISIQDPEMNILYSNWKGIADILGEKRILTSNATGPTGI